MMSVLEYALDVNKKVEEILEKCKELGIESVACDIHTYDNEDQILQDLLETNIRQRGDVGGSAKKVGRRIKELERLYGIKVGNPNYEKNSQLKKQEDLANELGISKQAVHKRISKISQKVVDFYRTKIR